MTKHSVPTSAKDTDKLLFFKKQYQKLTTGNRKQVRRQTCTQPGEKNESWKHKSLKTKVIKRAHIIYYHIVHNKPQC